MRTLALILISVFCIASSSALAASYQRTDGTIVDPILDTLGNVHPYSGGNVGPGAGLTFADLSSADLASADLAGSLLGFANLTSANLSNADFTSALAANSSWAGADVTGADFTAISSISNANGLGATTGAALYAATTDFSGAWADEARTIPFDPVAAGWTLVPEPSAATLIALGLAGLAARRR